MTPNEKAIAALAQYYGQMPRDDYDKIYDALTAAPPAIELTALERAKMWLDTEPNAPKHFTKHGNESARETIRALINNAIAAQKGSQS